MKTVLFLYTEIAPYLLASVERLVKDHPVEVHIVCWPVNKEAPFEFRSMPGVKLYDRGQYDEQSLLGLVDGLKPDVVLASGWIDRGYLATCRKARRQGIPTVMCSDTIWRGSARQWVAVLTSRLWLHRSFSHAWVSGGAQAEYARRLGFPKERVKLGFYSADLSLFEPLAEKFAPAKEQHYPHRLLCVARYIPSKGHQYLAQAFAALCEAGRAGDWELWFIGTGELYPLAFQHPRVKHLGFVQADEVWKRMEACGAFILPSLSEPWGVVVHEHAAAGFPLLLSDAVGAGERFLREGWNGWRFKAGDTKDLSRVLEELVRTPDGTLLEMGRRSAELGRGWGPANWAETLMEVIGQGHV